MGHAGVDYVKAVTWWYSDQTELGNPHDKLDLYLERFDGTNWVTVASDNSNDNKQRVFAVATQYPHRLRVFGRAVTNTTTNCGSPGIRVFHAILTEDNARDDVDGQGQPELLAIRPEVMP